jgi:hypothetical protein
MIAPMNLYVTHGDSWWVRIAVVLEVAEGIRLRLKTKLESSAEGEPSI